MKKIIFSIFTVATISGYMGYATQEKPIKNALVMANVEALSDNREDIEKLYYWPCAHGEGAQCTHHENYERCYHKREC